jgi:hypothetical protein
MRCVFTTWPSSCFILLYKQRLVMLQHNSTFEMTRKFKGIMQVGTTSKLTINWGHKCGEDLGYFLLGQDDVQFDIRVSSSGGIWRPQPQGKKIVYSIGNVSINLPIYTAYYYYYVDCCCLVVIVVSCHRPFLPGTSHEPTVIPRAQASSFRLQYFPYQVWCSKYRCLL